MRKNFQNFKRKSGSGKMSNKKKTTAKKEALIEEKRAGT